MLSTTRPDSVIRRLCREHGQRDGKIGDQQDNEPVLADVNVALTIDKLAQAATEMNRLRAMVAMQQGLIWDQKQELAEARRQLADGLHQSLQSDRLYQFEKIRAELAETRADQLQRETLTLRTQVGNLASAVSRAFSLDDTAVELRVVA